jgi:hypothetical protein
VENRRNRASGCRTLVYVPAGLLGTAAGFAFYQKLSGNQFTRAPNLLLIVSGLSFLR